MWNPFRIVLVLLLILSQAGCASYRPAVLPIESPPAEMADVNRQYDGEISVNRSDSGENVVGVGDEVRIILRSGDVVEGEVLRLSDTDLVLGNFGNYGVVETVIGFSDIEGVEARYSAQGASFAASTVGVFVILFLGLAALASTGC